MHNTNTLNNPFYLFLHIMYFNQLFQYCYFINCNIYSVKKEKRLTKNIFSNQCVHSFHILSNSFLTLVFLWANVVKITGYNPCLTCLCEGRLPLIHEVPGLIHCEWTLSDNLADVHSGLLNLINSWNESQAQILVVLASYLIRINYILKNPWPV